jgi:hypothetical protein
MTRAAAVKRSRLQTESDSDENDPDKLADETVVAIPKVPLIVEKGADAVTVKLKVAVPTPPTTASSSASVSSIMVSILFLLVNPWLMTYEGITVNGESSSLLS